MNIQSDNGLDKMEELPTSFTSKYLAQVFLVSTLGLYLSDKRS
jgi:hypothetical protein